MKYSDYTHEQSVTDPIGVNKKQLSNKHAKIEIIPRSGPKNNLRFNNAPGLRDSGAKFIKLSSCSVCISPAPPGTNVRHYQIATTCITFSGITQNFEVTQLHFHGIIIRRKLTRDPILGNTATY